MNLKHFMLLLLFSSLATGLGAQSYAGLDGGWQVAQVQVPPRVPPPLSRRAAVPATPAATAATSNAPAAGPPAPGLPALPKTPAPTNATPGVTADSIGKTNDPADITYDFLGIPLDPLLDIYAELIHRTLLRSTSGPGAVPKDATIALKTQSPLTHAEAIIALETILGMNGITIVPIGDKFAKVVAEAQAGAEGGPISTNTNNMPEAGKMVTQVVQIKYTDIKDLSEVLTPFSRMPKSIIALPSTQTLILRDYAENVDRMLEMIKKIDVVTPLVIKPRVIPIKYALASDIASALSALGASGGVSVGKSSTGANFSLNNSRGGSGGGFGGTGGGIGQGGYGSQGGMGSSVFGQANNTSALNSAATGARSSFQQNLAGIVKNAAGAGQFQLFGQTKIIADERTNSLLVFANDEDMKMITNIIEKLDVVLPQVLLDAIIMEINLQDTQNTGVSYLAQRQGGGTFTGAGGINNLSSAASSFLSGSSSSTTNGTTTVTGSGSTLANLPGGFSYFSKWGNDLNVVMEAVAGDSRVNVLSRPRIQTSHAVPADLFIGNTVPYVTGTYNYGYGSGPSSQYTQLEVGIHLQVLPLINKDGLVVMDIQADVEQLGPDVQISGVGGVPTTTKRQAGAKVAVKDGETIILGGFISDSRSLSDSGIPGLMNIPWLGNLFKSKSIENLRTELIMLMRPTVLPSPELAAVVAREERNKLSGVKQAELEIRQEEEDRNAAIEAELVKDAAKRAEKAKKEAKEKAKKASSGGTTNAPTVDSIPPVEGK
jgi:general secretion pathway protein D